MARSFITKFMRLALRRLLISAIMSPHPAEIISIDLLQRPNVSVALRIGAPNTSGAAAPETAIVQSNDRTPFHNYFDLPRTGLLISYKI